MSIKHALFCKGFLPIDMDIPYIQYILQNIQQAQAALYPYDDLHSEIPIVVVDEGVIFNE